MRLLTMSLLITSFVTQTATVLGATPSPSPSPSARAKIATRAAPKLIAKPAPRPTVPFVKRVPRAGPPILIQPRVALAPGPTFDLLPGSTPLKSSGTVIIRFRPLNAGQELSPTAPILIDLHGDGKISLNPYLIMRKSWKPGTTQIAVRYSGAIPKRTNVIRADAAFTVCKKGTKSCVKARKDNLSFSFIPLS